MEVLQARKEAERRQFQAEKEYEDAKAELERQKKDAATSRAVQDKSADIQRKQTMDEAKRKEQVALLKSPEVQDLLAPFFSKGYWQPSSKRGSYEPGPISLNSLRQLGALRSDTQGLEKLLWAGRIYYDKERPRWPYGPTLSGLPPKDRDKVVQAHKYLIEMGELMVQEGYLAP